MEIYYTSRILLKVLQMWAVGFTKKHDFKGHVIHTISIKIQNITNRSSILLYIFLDENEDQSVKEKQLYCLVYQYTYK